MRSLPVIFLLVTLGPFAEIRFYVSLIYAHGRVGTFLDIQFARLQDTNAVRMSAEGKKERRHERVFSSPSLPYVTNVLIPAKRLSPCFACINIFTARPRDTRWRGRFEI